MANAAISNKLTRSNVFTKCKQARKLVIGRQSRSLPCNKQEAWQQRTVCCATCVEWAVAGSTFPSNLASNNIIVLIMWFHQIRQLEIPLDPCLHQSTRLTSPVVCCQGAAAFPVFHKMKTTGTIFSYCPQISVSCRPQ
jgi:hypothetical protein